MKVIIDRAKWNTGGRLAEDGGAALYLAFQEPDYDDDNESELNSGHQESLCCLGFLGESCGFTREAMLGHPFPSDLPSKVWPSALGEETHCVPPGYYGSDQPIIWQQIFADMNDHCDVPDDVRESWISTGFRIVLGCDVEFIGEYPEAAP